MNSGAAIEGRDAAAGWNCLLVYADAFWTRENLARGADPSAALVSAGRAYTGAEELLRAIREASPAPERTAAGPARPSPKSSPERRRYN